MSFDATRQEISFLPHLQESQQSLHYEHLVIALGSDAKLPDLAGLKERARSMQSIDDAVKSRRLLVSRLEEAEAQRDNRDLQKKLLSFAVIGGGYTGVELASEMKDFLNQAQRHYPGVRAEDISVNLIEMTDRLLPDEIEKLGRAASRRLQSQAVQIHLGQGLKKVTGSDLELASGKKILADVVYWCGGIIAPSIVKQLPLPKNEKGMILTTLYLNVTGHHNIWAIGDCAANPDAGGNILPPTAQVADKLARHLVRNIMNALRDKPWLANRVKSSGMIIPLGSRFAIMRIGNVVFKGMLPWYLWCFYHSLKIPVLNHKLKVLSELMIDSLLGRDVGDPGILQKSKTKVNRVA